MLQQQWFQSNNKFNQELLEPARTLRVVDCTLTFYLKTCEIPQVFSGPLQRLLFQTKSLDTNSETFLTAKFSRPIQRLFLRPKFSRPIPRLFLRPNISKPILRLFLRLKFFDTDTETFFRDQICRYRYRHSQKMKKKSQYWEVSRRDVTLWSAGSLVEMGDQSQGGRSWQPFVEGKKGHENFRQARIYYFGDKCILLAHNPNFANLTQYNM